MVTFYEVLSQLVLGLIDVFDVRFLSQLCWVYYFSSFEVLSQLCWVLFVLYFEVLYRLLSGFTCPLYWGLFQLCWVLFVNNSASQGWWCGDSTCLPGQFLWKLVIILIFPSAMRIFLFRRTRSDLKAPTNNRTICGYYVIVFTGCSFVVFLFSMPPKRTQRRKRSAQRKPDHRPVTVTA